MAEVSWEGLSPSQYEDMVSVLLSNLNPEIRRIDGSGGDGGRDSEFRREHGTEIFQAKSFTGRLTKGRRRQVVASLKKAAERSPLAWHLIMPIDPTPGEQDWFDGLQAEKVFPISWEGRTWLNSQMAERPFIPRYFIEGASEQVVEILTQLREEQAAITDIRVGMDRLKALAERFNEIDPFYRFDLSVRDKAVEVHINPRYEGAELDHPINVNFRLMFPDNPEGRAAAEGFRAAMDFGTPAQVAGQFIQSIDIKAPAGFGGSFAEGGTLNIGPPQPVEDWTLPIVLCAISPNDVPQAELPITMTEQTTGRRGAIVKGADRAEAFFVTMQLDLETHLVHVNFKFASTADHFPQDLLPALTFMRGVLDANRIQVLLSEDRVPLGEAIKAPDLPPIEDEYFQMVADLARVQRETGTYFSMPAELSREDLRELSQCVDLLDGKDVPQPWQEASFVLDVTDTQLFRQEMLSKSEGNAFLIEAEFRTPRFQTEMK